MAARRGAYQQGAACAFHVTDTNAFKRNKSDTILLISQVEKYDLLDGS